MSDTTREAVVEALWPMIYADMRWPGEAWARQRAEAFADAAIQAILPKDFVGFIVKGEDKIKRRVYTDADAEVWVDGE